MKLTVEIDFEDCLKACLDYAEKKMMLFSEIIGKKIDKKELITIVRASSDNKRAKSVMVEEYDLHYRGIKRDVPVVRQKQIPLVLVEILKPAIRKGFGRVGQDFIDNDGHDVALE